MADGDNVSGSAHIQIRPSEGDKAWVSHSVLVPAHTSDKGFLKNHHRNFDLPTEHMKNNKTLYIIPATLESELVK